MFDTMHRLDFAPRAPIVRGWPARVATRLDAIADPEFPAARDLDIFTRLLRGETAEPGTQARILQLAWCAGVGGKIVLAGQEALLRALRGRVHA